MNKKSKNLMINKEYTYAIIGASNNSEKFGYKVFLDLKNSGFKLIPINPSGGEINGAQAYKSILDVEEKIDVAVFIVPSQVSKEVIKEVNEKGIKKAWFQPGSFDDTVIDYCKANNIEQISNACIMVEKNRYS